MELLLLNGREGVRNDVGAQGSISPMFYEKLLYQQIPKAQKDNFDFLHFWYLCT